MQSRFPIQSAEITSEEKVTFPEKRSAAWRLLQQLCLKSSLAAWPKDWSLLAPVSCLLIPAGQSLCLCLSLLLAASLRAWGLGWQCVSREPWVLKMPWTTDKAMLIEHHGMSTCSSVRWHLGIRPAYKLQAPGRVARCEALCHCNVAVSLFGQQTSS